MPHHHHHRESKKELKHENLGTYVVYNNRANVLGYKYSVLPAVPRSSRSHKVELSATVQAGGYHDIY